MRSRLQNDVFRMVLVCMILTIAFVSGVGLKTVKAQEAKFPSKPIEVIVPMAHGGIVDVVSRIVVESLSRELKVPIVVTARPGGGGLIASTAFVSNTKPDGYTLLAAPAGAIIPTVLLSKTPPFDPRKDLLPVGYIGDTAIGLYVLEKSPFKSFHELLQFAKSNPRKLIGGYSAPGSELHIMFNAILADTNIETKSVPYVEGVQLIPAFMGGHLDWITYSLSSGNKFIKSRDWRLLLLTRRVPEYPDVPVGPDIGLPNFSGNIWIGFFVLPQTPKVVYERLVAAMKTALEDPETGKKLGNLGIVCAYKNPREFSDLINNEWGAYSQVIKKTGLKVD